MRAKRAFDLALSVPGLILLSPLFLLLSVWIRMDSAGPAFFLQARVGRHGKSFRIIKFRTMVADAEEKGPQITAEEDPRITRAGRFLRRYKLDELPQLVNVVLGQMSLVGPRPEVPRYVEYYPDDLRDRILSVSPGITDVASLEFRDEGAMLRGSADPEAAYLREILPAKLRHYERYMRTRSLLSDAALLLDTVRKIFR